MLVAYSIFALIAIIAEQLRPARRQAFFRAGLFTDGVYVVLSIGLRIVFTNTIALEFTRLGQEHLPAWVPVAVLADRPLWLQTLAVIVVLDFFFYWMHRAKHRWNWLWRLHETHHSSRELDWFSSVRFNPLEKIIDRTIYLFPLTFLGAGEQALLILSIVDAGIATFSHANIRMRYGPLIYVLVGPEMHRWHHARTIDAQRSNFGNNLSVFDWIFGTARVRPEAPEQFGIDDESFPEGNILRQFVYTFRPHEPPRPAHAGDLMLALLPWLTLTALVFAFRRRGRALGTALVAALVWWSALLALGSEVLGQGHALTRSGVVVYWVLLALLTVLWAVRSRAGTAVARAATSGSRSELALAIGVVVVLALALLTTVLLPANSQDVMTYHMPRVLHWVQNASLEPFPTSDSRQLYHPPFAELVDLHFFLLLGRDQWVGPSRVLFLAGAAIGAAEVARRLAPEGGRLAAVGAAVMAVSAPLTLGSVVGGKNDPVAGFFLVALALALLAACERPDWNAALEAGLALGLALLTKTTALLFAPPFVALLCVVLILRHRRRAWRPVLALFVLPPLLMAGHMARNFSVYGHPVADPSRVEVLSIVDKSPGATLSNVLRLSSEHLGGPWESWNRWLERGVNEAHGWFGLDADDRRTTYAMEHFGVDNALRLDIYAGSPAHFLLALLALGLVVSRPTLRRERTRVLYGLALAGAALAMCASLRWSSTVTRLESPLFLLAAPLIGVALAGSGAWRPSLYALLLVAALPWILLGTGRAVIGPSAVLSASPRAMLYASTDPGLWKPVAEAAAWIGARGHHNVGLQPDDSVIAEYPLWLTLKEHVPGLRLEHVNATGACASPASWPAYRDFVPDAVLRVMALDPDQRRPLEPQLMVGKQVYALRFRNERLGVYERSER